MRRSESHSCLTMALTLSLLRLSIGSEVAERDIVQFVPFRKFDKVSPYRPLRQLIEIDCL